MGYHVALWRLRDEYDLPLSIPTLHRWRHRFLVAPDDQPVSAARGHGRGRREVLPHLIQGRARLEAQEPASYLMNYFGWARRITQHRSFGSDLLVEMLSAG
jgi:hypothetical protein